MTLECRAVIELGVAAGYVTKKTLEVSGSCDELVKQLVSIEREVYEKQGELMWRGVGKTLGKLGAFIVKAISRTLRRRKLGGS